MAYNQKIIKCDLSVESIDKAIRQLDRYKKRLEKLNEKLVKELVQKGYDVVDGILDVVPPSEINYDRPKVRKTKLVVTKNGVTASVTLTGEQALAVEFGTGVKFNGPLGTSRNPHGQELGWTIGSGSYGNWEGAQQADNPDGWWYMDKNGEFQHTYGHIAYQPMTQAELAITSEVINIAKSVYGGL